MNIVEYRPAYANALSAALSNVDFDAPLLRHDAYVRHYFLGNPECRLFLLLGNDGSVAATLGSERVRVQVADSIRDAVVLSNTYSIREGAFSFLYLQWMKSAELGIMFPGNALLRNLLAQQKRWQRIPGLRTYWLNWHYPTLPQDSTWKRLLKPAARRLTRIDQERFRAKIERMANGELEINEQARFEEDMPTHRPAFGFRLVGDARYLNWRFSTTLDYVKYRLFRIARCGSTVGHVVLAEWPNSLIVSYCDGDDPTDLALGILLAISAVNRRQTRYRKVVLSSMHAAMQSVFERFGFRYDGNESSFSMAVLGSHRIALEPRSDWLVNMDVGDSGTMAGMVYLT